MSRWPWSWPRAGFPIPNQRFPNLIFGKNGNNKRTSWSTSRYNCTAWAADDPMRPWWPQSFNAYWPSNAINDNTIPAFVSAFQTLGYEVCADGSLEPGFEKVAIYARPDKKPQHAARQLRDGRWTSKMGLAYWPDIRHDTLDVVSGPVYGAPVCYMRRPRKSVTFTAMFARLIRLGRIQMWEITTFVKWVRFGGRMYDNYP